MTDTPDLDPVPADDGPVLSVLTARLSAAGVEFAVSRHEPVFTSAQAAAVRGSDLHSGAKALIVKARDRFVMIVLPADLPLDSKVTKRALGGKSLRFATHQEVSDLTGLEPGAIPPFGSLFDLPTCCDERLADNVHINFNAGAHHVSVSMRYTDYVCFERPQLGRFAAGSSPPDSSA